MKFIIGTKIYDTKTSEEIIKFRRKYPSMLISGHTFYSTRDTTLYRSKNNIWFTVCECDYERLEIYEETDDSVKKLFTDLVKIDLYEKYFEKLEEA